MLGQRVINNMLGNKPKADRKSKNSEDDYFEKFYGKKCPYCKKGTIKGISDPAVNYYSLQCDNCKEEIFD